MTAQREMGMTELTLYEIKKWEFHKCSMMACSSAFDNPTQTVEVQLLRGTVAPQERHMQNWAIDSLTMCIM